MKSKKRHHPALHPQSDQAEQNIASWKEVARHDEHRDSTSAALAAAAVFVHSAHLVGSSRLRPGKQKQGLLLHPCGDRQGEAALLPVQYFTETKQRPSGFRRALRKSQTGKRPKKKQKKKKKHFL